MKSPTRRAATILWPAFLLAAVLEIAVFAFVDPGSLHTLAGNVLPLSDTAIYSLAFLVFWICTAVACALTVLLELGAEELNTQAPPGR